MNWFTRARTWWAARRARVAREQAFIETYENYDDYLKIRALKNQHVDEWRAWRDGLGSSAPSRPRRPGTWRDRHKSDAVLRGERDRDTVTHVSFGEPCHPHYIDWVVVPGAYGRLTLVPREMAGDPSSQRR